MRATRDMLSATLLRALRAHAAACYDIAAVHLPDADERHADAFAAAAAAFFASG